MLDPQLIRNDLDAIATRLASRGVDLDRERIAALEAERKRLQVDTQALQQERNERSKAIGKAKGEGQDIGLGDLFQRGLKGGNQRVGKLLDEANRIREQRFAS